VDGWLVLGFEVCGFVPDGLLCVWAGAEPEGVVLSGLVVCAKTQLAHSSNMENSVALAFMAVSRLRYDLVTYRTVGSIPSRKNPADPLGLQRRYRTPKPFDPTRKSGAQLEQKRQVHSVALLADL
jgi:hypothetical protein